MDPQDFSQVLSSMCTEPHPTAYAAAKRFLATNPGDPGTYKAVADLEEDAVSKLGRIVGLADPVGYITSGGTEANIQAMHIARNHADTSNPNIVAPESAHFSFHKAADLLDVELRFVPVDTDYRALTEAIKNAVDRNTVAVVGVAGTTEYGRVDPIPSLAEIAHDTDAILHVDAAWGGFYLPFTDHGWSFKDAKVDTMTINPHKVGQAAIPAGGLLARSTDLFDELAVEAPYLESTSQATLTGTRSGAGIASTVAAIDELWPDGYRECARREQANAEWFAEALKQRGYSVVTPELPLVAAEVETNTFEALRAEGWRISRTGSDELRVVCMPHVTREMLQRFIDDLENV